MSFGPSTQSNFRRAAGYADKILKAAKPGEVPIEQPTMFELVLNLKIAKAMGLTFRQFILVRADRVILCPVQRVAVPRVASVHAACRPTLPQNFS